MQESILGNFNDFMSEAHKAKQGKIEFDSNLRFFIKFSKPADDQKSWITVYIKYEMQKFSVYAGITDKPLPFFRELSKNFIEIPKEFADEIKTNETFIKTLKYRLHERLVYKELDLINPRYYDKVFEVLAQKGVSTERNNMIVQAQQENAITSARLAAEHKKIVDAAEKYGKGQVWGWYKEYYRGAHGSASDDDYEGSGETTFLEVAQKLCKSEEDVKKLARQNVNFRIEHIEGHYRYYYVRIK